MITWTKITTNMANLFWRNKNEILFHLVFDNEGRTLLWYLKRRQCDFFFGFFTKCFKSLLCAKIRVYSRLFCLRSCQMTCRYSRECFNKVAHLTNTARYAESTFIFKCPSFCNFRSHVMTGSRALRGTKIKVRIPQNYNFLGRIHSSHIMELWCDESPFCIQLFWYFCEINSMN